MGGTIDHATFAMALTQPVIAGMDLLTGQPIAIGSDGQARRAFEGVAGYPRAVPKRSDSAAGSAWDLDLIRQATRFKVREGWLIATGMLDGRPGKALPEQDRSMYPALPAERVVRGSAGAHEVRVGPPPSERTIVVAQAVPKWRGPVNLIFRREAGVPAVYQVLDDGTKTPYDPLTGGSR